MAQNSEYNFSRDVSAQSLGYEIVFYFSFSASVTLLPFLVNDPPPRPMITTHVWDGESCSHVNLRPPSSKKILYRL